MRWVEIIGEGLVLISAGFQVFVVSPLTSQAERAYFVNLDLGIARLEARSHSIRANPDATTAKLHASMELDRLLELQSELTLYAGITFLIGTGLALLGKAIRNH